MKVLVDKEIIPFNKLHKNCLKNTDSMDYIDEATSYEFKIYDDNNQQIGKVEAYLDDNKAGLQITRLKQNTKDLQSQLNILLSVINYIWEYVNINHCVLAIHIWVEGSGIEQFNLLQCGFVGQAAQVKLGSKLFTLLNPDYEEIVFKKTTDQETKEALIKIYNRNETNKKSQQRELEDMINTNQRFLQPDEIQLLQEQEIDTIHQSIELYQECLNALSDDIPKNRR